MYGTRLYYVRLGKVMDIDQQLDNVLSFHSVLFFSRTMLIVVLSGNSTASTNRILSCLVDSHYFVNSLTIKKLITKLYVL